MNWAPTPEPTATEDEIRTYFKSAIGGARVISEPDACIELTVLDYPPIRIHDAAWTAFVEGGYRTNPRPVPSIEARRPWWQFWRSR